MLLFLSGLESAWGEIPSLKMTRIIYTYTQLEIVSLCCVLFFMIMLSVCGNILLIWIICTNSKMRTTQNIFVASLACTDAGLGIICMPLTLVATAYDGWILPDAMGKLHGFCIGLLFMTTLWTITAMTIDKYFTIVYPLNRTITVSRTKYIIAGIWIMTSIWSAMPLLGWQRYTFNSSTHSYGLAIPKNIAEKMFLHMTMILGFAVPLGVMAYAYTRIYRAVQQHSKRISGFSRGKSAAEEVIKTQQHLIKTLIIVLTLFIVCWTPFCIFIVLGSFSEGDHIKWVGTLAYWFGFSASCWNPIVYVSRSNRYKEAAIAIWVSLKRTVCFWTRDDDEDDIPEPVMKPTNDIPMGFKKRSGQEKFKGLVFENKYGSVP